MNEHIDKTALSFWFPLIAAAGVPVPKTKIVPLGREAQRSLLKWIDGEAGDGAEKPFFEELGRAADEIGYPAFLRTDHTSDKHSWEDTCFLNSAGDLKRHVYNLAESSELAGFIGLPWDVWAVREFLPTMPVGVCPRFGNMPLCREFRFFVEGGEIKCWHPYWPMGAIEQGEADPSLYEKVTSTPPDIDALHELARRVSRAVEGAWSVDILETKRGWYVTDMAEAHKSFHWEGCPNAGDPESKS